MFRSLAALVALAALAASLAGCAGDAASRTRERDPNAGGGSMFRPGIVLPPGVL
jgi:uncharacterized lipoprotein